MTTPEMDASSDNESDDEDKDRDDKEDNEDDDENGNNDDEEDDEDNDVNGDDDDEGPESNEEAEPPDRPAAVEAAAALEMLLLVDAANEFNILSRYSMLWTVRHRCPRLATYSFNCYRHQI